MEVFCFPNIATVKDPGQDPITETNNVSTMILPSQKQIYKSSVSNHWSQREKKDRATEIRQYRLIAHIQTASYSGPEAYRTEVGITRFRWSSPRQRRLIIRREASSFCVSAANSANQCFYYVCVYTWANLLPLNVDWISTLCYLV